MFAVTLTSVPALDARRGGCFFFLSFKVPYTLSRKKLSVNCGYMCSRLGSYGAYLRYYLHDCFSHTRVPPTIKNPLMNMPVEVLTEKKEKMVYLGLEPGRYLLHWNEADLYHKANSVHVYTW